MHSSNHSGEEVQQSASLLGPAYEQLFHSPDVPTRPLDSLVILFRYFCATEAHYLDMVATVLEDSIPDSHAVPIARKRESIPDIRRIILHCHRMLRRRRAHITDILQYLDWHAAVVSEGTVGDVSTGKLLKTDLEHLLLSNADLMSRCQHDLDSMTSEATFEDAERGITLSKSSRKFTAFAAIYVPLAFTSSVFGMNFIQIDDVSWGFKLWVLVTIPICFLSYVVFAWDTGYAKRCFGRMFSCRSTKRTMETLS